MANVIGTRATDIAALKKEKWRRAELRRCQTDLYYLATEKLGYGWNPEAGSGYFRGKGLTARLHKAICKWLDDNRLAHFMMLLMARFHHKTTIIVASIIQDLLINPNTYLFYFHAVDRLAEEVVDEAGHHLLTNPKLRELEPIGYYGDKWPEADKRGKWFKALPRKNVKRWLKADQFTLNRVKYVRFPSLLGKGAGSEVTGAHCAKAYLDDIIGKRAIEDNLVGKIGNWVEHTIMPVVDDLTIRAVGTPWSDYGVYEDWKIDQDWTTCELPGSTVEDLADINWGEQHIRLTPDYTLQNPIYGPDAHDPKQIKKLEILKRQMKGNFGKQIMVDTSQKGAKPWSEVDERAIMIPARSSKYDPRGISAAGRGVIFVLSDPAPKYVGSPDAEKEKARADDTKDFWAIAVVKFRRRGMMIEKILLDLSVSRGWDTDSGFDEVCRLMLRWHTNKAIHESYGGLNADYHKAMRQASKRNAVPWMEYDKEGKPIKFRVNYVKAARNVRFADLCADARDGGFYIADTVPKKFLEGEPNTRHQGFFPQSRDWQCLASGRNGLSYDDIADVTSRCEDPIFEDYAPVVEHVDPTWRDFMRQEEEDELSSDGNRTRYISI